MSNLEYNYPEVFDINTLAQYLGCSSQTVRIMVKEYKIPTYRLGRKYFFRKCSIDNWLSSQEDYYTKLNLRKTDLQETVKRINSL